MKEKFYITNKKKLLFVIKSIVCCILDFKPYGHGINLRIMFSNLTRYQIPKACQHIQELENKETQSNGFGLYELALHFTEQIHVDGSQWGAIQRLVQTTDHLPVTRPCARTTPSRSRTIRTMTSWPTLILLRDKTISRRD